jgi:hypothetical protein
MLHAKNEHFMFIAHEIGNGFSAGVEENQKASYRNIV